MKTKASKAKYSVFLLEVGTGCYRPFHCVYVGDTWAASERKAISNISFREGIPAVQYIGDYAEEGYLTIELRACLAHLAKDKKEEWKKEYDQAV